MRNLLVRPVAAFAAFASIASIASIASVLLLFTHTAATAAAAAWPDRPVRIVVPFPAGAAADSSTRVLARKLGEMWKQPVIVDNRPGAPGVISAINSQPDGYTLLLGAGSLIVTNPLLNKRVAYDPQRDLVPVVQVLTNTPILTVHPSLGIKTVKDLVAYATRKPGELNYSSSGMGSPNHLMMEMFTAQTATRMVHIAYKGAAPSVQELLAGTVQLGINATPSVLQHIKTGKLVPLAVTTRKRDRAFPDVPTMIEAGYPNFDFTIWYGLFAPSRTPAALVSKINLDVQGVLQDPELVQQFAALGADAAPTTADRFAAIVQSDRVLWGRLIKEKKLSLGE